MGARTHLQHRSAHYYSTRNKAISEMWTLLFASPTSRRRDQNMSNQFTTFDCAVSAGRIPRFDLILFHHYFPSLFFRAAHHFIDIPSAFLRVEFWSENIFFNCALFIEIFSHFISFFADCTETECASSTLADLRFVCVNSFSHCLHILIAYVLPLWPLLILRDRDIFHFAIYLQLNYLSSQSFGRRISLVLSNEKCKAKILLAAKSDPNITNSAHRKSKRICARYEWIRSRHLNRNTIQCDKPKRVPRIIHSFGMQSWSIESDWMTIARSAATMLNVNGMNVNGHNLKWRVSDLSFPLLLQLTASRPFLGASVELRHVRATRTTEYSIEEESEYRERRDGLSRTATLLRRANFLIHFLSRRHRTKL